jgi:hypothetical protein
LGFQPSVPTQHWILLNSPQLLASSFLSYSARDKTVILSQAVSCCQKVSVKGESERLRLLVGGVLYAVLTFHTLAADKDSWISE